MIFSNVSNHFIYLFTWFDISLQMFLFILSFVQLLHTEGLAVIARDQVTTNL